MIFRTLNPTDPKTVAKELSYGLTDAQLIKYTENIFHTIRYYEERKNEGQITEEYWKIENARLRESLEMFLEECKAREITYIEKHTSTEPFNYWYYWFKNHEYIFVCQICEKEVANRSGFCPKCEGQVDDLTDAWNRSSQGVKDYFREKIKEEYEDD